MTETAIPPRRLLPRPERRAYVTAAFCLTAPCPPGQSVTAEWAPLADTAVHCVRVVRRPRTRLEQWSVASLDVAGVRVLTGPGGVGLLHQVRGLLKAGEGIKLVLTNITRRTQPARVEFVHAIPNPSSAAVPAPLTPAEIGAALREVPGLAESVRDSAEAFNRHLQEQGTRAAAYAATRVREQPLPQLPRCSGRNTSGFLGAGIQCGSPGTHHEDGKPWCAAHAPSHATSSQTRALADLQQTLYQLQVAASEAYERSQVVQLELAFAALRRVSVNVGAAGELLDQLERVSGGCPLPGG